jgi:hypothetical protein
MITMHPTGAWHIRPKLTGLVQGSSNNGGEDLTSAGIHHKPSLECIRGPVRIAPPPVSDKGGLYFATVTSEHHPGTRLAEYDQDATNTMHGTQISDSRQGVVSGDTEDRPSTTSSIIDLDGLIDEGPRPPSDSFQVWIAHSTKIMPEHREKF